MGLILNNNPDKYEGIERYPLLLSLFSFSIVYYKCILSL
nr:MAG TPA: hypothetical protein [Caudoviricetes sp.]